MIRKGVDLFTEWDSSCNPACLVLTLRRKLSCVGYALVWSAHLLSVRSCSTYLSIDVEETFLASWGMQLSQTLDWTVTHIDDSGGTVGRLDDEARRFSWLEHCTVAANIVQCSKRLTPLLLSLFDVCGVILRYVR